MRSIAAVIVVLVLGVSTRAQSTRPAPSDERVLILSIDGLRPDVMLRAETPYIRGLLDRGSFSLWARTTEASVTLPSHTTMVTGVSPEKHKITWNRDVPDSELYHPRYPTLFELAKQAGYTTALVSGKSKFIALNKPGTIDFVQIPATRKNFTDAEIADRAADLIAEHTPHVMMTHFPGADTAGHSRGWGTAAQIEAIENIDKQVGRVIAAVEEAGVFDSTLIILTSDHGGAGRTHGKEDPRSRHIPWIAVGPAVRRNQDLTMYRDLVINTEDTFATACDFLGIEPGEGIEGKPILQIFADYEMLRPTTTPTTEPAILPGTTGPAVTATPAGG
jgi:arylsulfatase A-like enzyme